MAGVSEGEFMRCSPGDEPLTLRDSKIVGFHSYRKPLKGGSPSVTELTT